jgi:hypothetical protein
VATRRLGHHKGEAWACAPSLQERASYRYAKVSGVRGGAEAMALRGRSGKAAQHVPLAEVEVGV